MLFEKILSAGISRVTGISEAWIQNCINKKYEDIPKQTEDVFKKSILFCNVMEYGHLPDQRRAMPRYCLRLTEIDSRKIAEAYAGSRDKKGTPSL